MQAALTWFPDETFAAVVSRDDVEITKSNNHAASISSEIDTLSTSNIVDRTPGLSSKVEAKKKKRETIVREHFKTHPDHEKNWLSYFKEKLEERGEAQIYDGIESAYLELRNELLGLNNDLCNDWFV
jgi:hypothetical protein